MTVDSRIMQKVKAYLDSRQDDVGFYLNKVKTNDDGSVRTTDWRCTLNNGETFLDIYGRINGIKIYMSDAVNGPEYKAYLDINHDGILKTGHADQRLGFWVQVTEESMEDYLKAFLDARKAFSAQNNNLGVEVKNMINTDKLASILKSYREDFNKKNPERKNQTHWEDEQYKWIAIKHFRDYWNIDAEDFGAMFKEATAKHDNLLLSQNYFPGGMIQAFAEANQEATRQMFRNLYNEERPLLDRVNEFIEEAERLRSLYGQGRWQSHYQNANSISTYLWSRFPDKYYIYKYSECKEVAAVLDSSLVVKRNAKASILPGFMQLYDEIADFLIKENETKRMVEAALTPECYSDPQCHTLAIDVGFYISRYYEQEHKGYVQSDAVTEEAYWPSQKEYPVSVTKEEWKEYIGQVERPTHHGCMRMLKALIELGGEASCKKLSIVYGGKPSRYIGSAVNIGRRAKSYFNLPPCMDKDYERFFPIAFLGRQAIEDGVQRYVYKLREPLYEALREMDLSDIDPHVTVEDEIEILYEESSYDEYLSVNQNTEPYTKEQFLNEVFMTEYQYDSLVSLLRNKKNLILQGAPGVGKTYTAKRLAYAMMGNKDESRIEFVQFHQNYSYEDLMMGYKPTESGFKLKYGVFYRFCRLAEANPNKEYFFIIDEINRGNMSKIFGELLMLIEKDYRGEPITLAYNGESFIVPDNLYIIGMMNTADRSLAMIDYALRRRFSFYTMTPGFDSDGFKKYQKSLNNSSFDNLVATVLDLNKAIVEDKSLGTGFSIGHSYFCGHSTGEDDKWIKAIVYYDIIPTINEYWFDDSDTVKKWSELLKEACNG